MMRIKDFCSYDSKSSIKAGEALTVGKYAFFTSSADETKRINGFQYDGERIIMGTGGNATLHYFNGKFAVSTDCVVLKPDSIVLCKYLYYFFLANMRILEDGFKGAGLRHTNKNYIDNITIKTIPTIANQKNIVFILDKINTILKLRKKELQKADDLIKARFVEMFGDLRANPFGFKKKKLKDTCIVITGNTPSRSVPEYYGDYMEWIKTDNIVTGFLNPTKSVEYLSEAGVNVGRTVEKDSILMSCIAGSVASIGRVCITNRKVAFNQQINAVIPKEYDVLFLYVMLQMSKDYLTEEINMALKGILSKSKLEEKKFVIPPIKQQKQFATFVTQVDKSKVAVQKSLEQTQMLFDSLLQQYFG